jgi:Uma2 family endonuclease
MASLIHQASAARKTQPPPLVHGERLDQKTFHERYEAMPSHVRAELIGGIVNMPSPQKRRHSVADPRLTVWLDDYAAETPGTELLSNATYILGPESERQPDASLVLAPEFGGRTWVDDEDYVHGPAELVAENSDATESIDLSAKKLDYERAAVQEYIVVALRQKKIFWFVRRRGKFKEITIKDGILRSQIFPGLWLDPDALLRRDRRALRAVLQQGLASPEHTSFVKKLEQRRERKK